VVPHAVVGDGDHGGGREGGRGGGRAPAWRREGRYGRVRGYREFPLRESVQERIECPPLFHPAPPFLPCGHRGIHPVQIVQLPSRNAVDNPFLRPTLGGKEEGEGGRGGGREGGREGGGEGKLKDGRGSLLS
jgi:hypothetical protein